MKITKTVTIRLNHDDIAKAIMAYLEQRVEAKIAHIELDVSMDSQSHIKTFSAKIHVDGDANFKEVTVENSPEA